MNYSLKVIKHGQTEYGQYALGSLANDIVLYNGIFNMVKPYDLQDGKIYKVKAVYIKQKENNKIRVTLELI